MNSSAAFSRGMAVGRVLTRALLLVSALSGTLSCASDDDSHSPMGPGGGASSAGEAGGAGIEAGDTGMGGSGTIAGFGGAAGAVHGIKPCFSDDDCNDGLYCNGIELCRSVFPGSDVMVCMGTEHGPCWPSPCSESTLCDCSHPDQDRDGYRVEGCSDGKDFDCDDTDGKRNPARPEVCDANQYDEDCDDRTFAGLGMDKHGHRDGDTDGDGYFAESCKNRAKYQPLFSTSQKPLTIGGTDCDDTDPSVHPGAAEVCDNLDNNCNGETDEVSGGQGDPHTYYPDQDGDYWGSDENPRDTLCNFPPPGYSVLHGDCNDSDPRISPVREEICNGIDDDCNGTVDQPEKPGDLLFAQPYDGVTQFECKGAVGWEVKQCPSARLDCDGSYLNACETLATTLCNCHACGKTCEFSCGDTDCEEIKALSTGDTHTCALVVATTGNAASVTPAGKVACWGRNAVGQLGDGTTKNSATPVLVPDVSEATAIALGERHSCAIAADSRILCWGDNELGQLGARSQQLQSVYPVQVRSEEAWGKATQLASGKSHTCAIYEHGLVACWGSKEYGQLGDGYSGEGLFNDGPVKVLREVGSALSFIGDATQVAAGEAHTCALAAGVVECWGDNEWGQLGEDPDSLTARAVAHPVPGLEGMVVDELVAGAIHTCVRSGTDVYCWGSNLFGELAQAEEMFGKPTKIPLPPDIISITAGRFFGCARSNDATVRCWGSNDSGQLATSSDIKGVPTLIPLPNVVGIFAGYGRHVCALTDGARTSCWGRNDFGQLGNPDLSDVQLTPKQVTALQSSQRCDSRF